MDGSPRHAIPGPTAPVASTGPADDVLSGDPGGSGPQGAGPVGAVRADGTDGADADAAAGIGLKSRLNWLRAGVLGANDGIVSVAALLVGVAAATTDTTAILVAGSASVVAGAASMALGEYVSVSSQRDSEMALINLERRELAEMPEEEFEELVAIYEEKGLSAKTARAVATELTEHDAL